MSEIEEMAKKLPPDLRIQVQNFMQFLIEQKKTEPEDYLASGLGGIFA